MCTYQILSVIIGENNYSIVIVKPLQKLSHQMHAITLHSINTILVFDFDTNHLRQVINSWMWGFLAVFLKKIDEQAVTFILQDCDNLSQTTFYYLPVLAVTGFYRWEVLN